jgi:hypothetical protein
VPSFVSHRRRVDVRSNGLEPSFRNVDLALARRLLLRLPLSIELRAEAFNVLNTPACGSPNAVLGAVNFGTITTAGDPRVIQLAVKLLF